MTEELYFKLLKESEVYCKSLSIHYLDFLHDLICDTDINNENYHNYFVKKRYSLHEEPTKFGIENGKIIGFTEQHTVYLYCYHCNQVLPESEFYKNSSVTRRICKAGYNEKNVRVERKKVQEMSDGYIKSILRKQNIEITKENISNKRKFLLKKRNRLKITERWSSGKPKY